MPESIFSLLVFEFYTSGTDITPIRYRQIFSGEVSDQNEIFLVEEEGFIWLNVIISVLL